jgi:decaprenylphospho-beta-D-erythro-pentofuranosid-2-ulose 2-reductase
MNIVIFGATSRIAECCAREWVARAKGGPIRLLLIARGPEKLEAIAQDLRLRCGPAGEVLTGIADFAELDKLPDIAGRAFAQLGKVDMALVAHGVLPNQTLAQQDHAQARDALLINGVSPALLAERIAEKMALQGSGTLAVISSVAGDRGRQSNYLYGSAKALLDCQLEGLRHRLWKQSVRVITIKPGPTATPMTSGLLPASGMASPEQVARDIVTGTARGTAVIYTPGKWRLIMLVIRNLPRFIFRRLAI